MYNFSDNIYLDRHYQCKIGDYGHCGDNLEFNYIEDIHGLGMVCNRLDLHMFVDKANSTMLSDILSQ